MLEIILLSLFLYVMVGLFFSPMVYEAINSSYYEGPTARATFGIMLLWPILLAGGIVFGSVWLTIKFFKNFFPAIGDVVKLAVTVGNK